jgi:hypothetical protein
VFEQACAAYRSEQLHQEHVDNPLAAYRAPINDDQLRNDMGHFHARPFAKVRASVRASEIMAPQKYCSLS